jgi:hypothetical protein
MAAVLFVVLSLVDINSVVSGPQRPNRLRPREAPWSREQLYLKEVPFKIVYETYRSSPDPAGSGQDNWELYMANADGSNPVNLTNTPDVDEMYPHVSPDGTKICFVMDEGTAREKVRSVCYMNIDGTEQVTVAQNAREPCWSSDSKSIAYLKGEYERYTTREYATSELMVYDLETGLHRPHPNKDLHHLYAICWSPCGKWFVAAVHGGMGYSDTILAFEAKGTRVFDLARWGVKGCRPDLNFDGTKMTWGETDWNLLVGDIDLRGDEPRVTNIREVVRCSRRYKVYHVDFSPDGRYIAFSFGPFSGEQQVGGRAKGWNICVSDISGAVYLSDVRLAANPPKWVRITADGNHNKEPDWAPVRQAVSPIANR